MAICTGTVSPTRRDIEVYQLGDGNGVAIGGKLNILIVHRYTQHGQQGFIDFERGKRTKDIF